MATTILPVVVRDHRRKMIDSVLTSKAFMQVTDAYAVKLLHPVVFMTLSATAFPYASHAKTVTEKLTYALAYPTKAPQAVQKIMYELRQARKNALISTTNGKIPYRKYTNVVNGAKWGSYVMLSKNDSYVKQGPIPTSSSWWDSLKGVLEDIGNVFVKIGEWIVDKLKKLCNLISSPGGQAAQGAVVAGLVAAGVISAGTTVIIGGAVALAIACCGMAGLTDAPGTGIMVVAAATALLAKYPAGSIGRYNVKTNLWSIYAPVGTYSGLGDPSPPSGTEKVADEPTLPTGVEDGGTEGEWYKSPVVLIGGGVALGAAVGGVWYLRRRRGRRR